MDYGHPLQFGSFITPVNADPARPVALAVLSEQLGLDLVTFQDHPYQPAFLDTWTLMSYVAAATGTVHLAPNVLNLPLRPPAITARSVAALDLLTGGRIELGLGAGAFWDPIVAMGGPRLTPGQAVRGMEEAIAVLRQTWDAGARGGVRVEGEVHRVVGAKRGPAPAHDVGIWVGAYRPRMLELTGRLADGWLPSLPYLKPGDLATGNAVIDDAAEAAGRAPADVRRLLNINGRFSASGRGVLEGPPRQWAEELAELALGSGIGTFILGTDDPDDLRRFAEDVAPAVRELVAAERSRPPSTGVAGSIPLPPATTGTAPSTAAGAPASAASDATGGAFTVVPTPDDGTRRSATQVWDESARPTGPDRDPARTYTEQELAQGRHLIDVHDHLRGELSRIQDLVEQVADGALDAGTARSHLNRMTMRQNRWTVGAYCESYCRIVTVHHTLEDQALFPRLRRTDPRLAPVVDRLEEEHHAIHGVLDAVDRALVSFVSGPDGGKALRDAVDLLGDTLLSHLAYEERELVEPLARLGIVV